MVTASAFSDGSVYPSDATGGSVTTVGPPGLVSTKHDWPTHWIDRLGDCAAKMAENTQNRVVARSSIGIPPLRLIHRDDHVDHREYVNSGRIDPGGGDDISSPRDAVQK